MRRRFWICAALTIPVFGIGMSDLIPGAPLQRLISGSSLAWVQLLLATPVVLWGGWPFFVRAWYSIVNLSLNMFTLIAMGTGVAWLYSVIATLALVGSTEEAEFGGNGGVRGQLGDGGVPALAEFLVE